MQTLFALEDLYGLKVDEIEGEICLTLDKESPAYLTMFDSFMAWRNETDKVKKGEISQEDYNNWRYLYPVSEIERTKASLNIGRKKK